MRLKRKWYNYLWCLPQVLLFLVVRFIILEGVTFEKLWKGRKIYRFDKTKKRNAFFSGTALFHTLLPLDAGVKTLAHEHGHHVDGDKKGWLYLPATGIPSLRNNLKARKAGWNKAYYHCYPEAEADELGGVVHTNCTLKWAGVPYCVREYKG